MKTLLRATGALMLGLSLCGGLSNAPVYAAPTKAAAKPAAKPAANGKKKAPNPMFVAISPTPDQKKKIGAIYKDQKTKIGALKADTRLSDADKKTKIKAVRKANIDKVNALLTPDQKKKFEAFRKKVAADNKAKAAKAKAAKAKAAKAKA